MTWYKFWKKSGSVGGLSEDYLWHGKKEEEREGSIKEICERWAEQMPGGHNSFYRYGFEEIEHPPIKELEKMIKAEEETIISMEKNLKFLKKTRQKIKG